MMQFWEYFTPKEITFAVIESLVGAGVMCVVVELIKALIMNCF